MSRHLLDLNTLLALLDPQHVFHEAAHRWVETTPGLCFLTCPLVQNGVVRIASQSTYPNALGTAATGLDLGIDFVANLDDRCRPSLALRKQRKGRHDCPWD